MLKGKKQNEPDSGANLEKWNNCRLWYAKNVANLG